MDSSGNDDVILIEEYDMKVSLGISGNGEERNWVPIVLLWFCITITLL